MKLFKNLSQKKSSGSEGQVRKTSPEKRSVIAALVVGCLAWFFQESHISSKVTEMSKKFETTQILTAATKLRQGTVLKPEDLRLTEFPKSMVTLNMMAATKYDDLIGKSITLDYFPGDPVLLTSINSNAANLEIAARIPPGKRLFTLAVSDPSVSAGMARPGMRVDVIANMEFPERGPTTFTILRNIEVVAMGREVSFGVESQSSLVSFFVTPREMETLAFAQERGSFRLAIRNNNDSTQTQSEGGVTMDNVTWDPLLMDAAKPVPKIEYMNPPRP